MDREKEYTGDIECWMKKLPWVSFRSSVNERFLTKQSVSAFTIGKPTFVNASFDVTNLATVYETNKECWELEWGSGHREALLKMLGTNDYWRLIKYTDNCHRLIIESFNERDKEGPYYEVNGRKMRPALFYIAVLGSNIAIQHVKSKYWLSVTDKNGTINGIEQFDESCHFEVGTKIAIFSKPSENENPLYFSISKFFGNKIGQDSLWVRKRQTFILFIQGSHFKIFAPIRNLYWALDNSNKLIVAQTPSKIVLGRGTPNWDIFISNPDYSKDHDPLVNQNPKYIRLLSRGDSIVSQTAVIFSELEKIKAVSTYGFALLPKESLYHKDQAISGEHREVSPPIVGCKDIDECTHEQFDRIYQFLTDCVDYIVSKYLTTEGLFRISGSKDRIEGLKTVINEGNTLAEGISILQKRNIFPQVEEVCSLLKQFFRELEKPLISNELSHKFNEITTSPPPDNTQQISKLVGTEEIKFSTHQRVGFKTVTNRQLSSRRKTVLSQICALLHKLALNDQHNKMTVSNLALVVGPNIVANDNDSILSTNSHWPRTFTIFIADCDYLFTTQIYNSSNTL